MWKHCYRRFHPVLAKHPKSFNLVDTLSVGVDRIQRNFEPLQRQVELWRKTQITDDTARLIFYSAFIDDKLEAPRTLLPEVHRLYFEPQYPEYAARTMWSLSNASTSALKKLDPVPQFKATAKLGGFLSTASIVEIGPVRASDAERRPACSSNGETVDRCSGGSTNFCRIWCCFWQKQKKYG
jgi:hypothetical protein